MNCPILKSIIDSHTLKTVMYVVKWGCKHYRYFELWETNELEAYLRWLEENQVQYYLRIESISATSKVEERIILANAIQEYAAK